MQFWQFTEPSLKFMVQVTRTGTAHVESEKQSAFMEGLCYYEQTLHLQKLYLFNTWLGFYFLKPRCSRYDQH